MHVQVIITYPLDKKLYLTMFACHFGRYRFIRLPCRMVPVDMFQQKNNVIFKSLPNVDIADDILIVGYYAEGRDHDKSG